ncbi:MAG: winged helix-turn-helix transcriptional regulator [Alphaproteobacteria bacterium]|nr:winged helix-turn-helix transcriptional regulator [Alphaproteobacteria bacterium]
MNTRNGAPVGGGPIEGEITLGLLQAVESDGQRSQRSLAQELGIALGLTNAYLKRCIRKGLIKVSEAPANRYAYYLTPKGFSEKGRLTAQYLSDSLRFYRRARSEIEQLLDTVATQRLTPIALVGRGDLSEIALLFASHRGVAIAGIIASEGGPEIMGVPTVTNAAALSNVAAFLVTDSKAPQSAYDALVDGYGRERVFAPPLLKIVRRP